MLRHITLWVPIIRSWALTRGFTLHPGTRNRYEIRYTRTQHRPPARQINDHGRVSGTHRPGGRCGWVQCCTMRRRCQRNSVSGVTSHPARPGRASAATIAPSTLRWASVSSGRSTCRRSTASWWRNTMISRSFERPDRTASRASDARNWYKIRYTRTQHRPASRHVNDHGRVSGTHRVRVSSEGKARQVLAGSLLTGCGRPCRCQEEDCLLAARG